MPFSILFFGHFDYEPQLCDFCLYPSQTVRLVKHDHSDHINKCLFMNKLNLFYKN